MIGAGAGAPLAGLKVIEMASFISGPYCGQLLADLGAEVTKIERPPLGDPLRAFGSTDGYGPNFVANNRSKRSALLDLRTSEDLGVLRSLLRTADVFIENHRPGVLRRLGVGYEAVAADNHRLIYCSITGFGSTGPYAARPAYDTIGQALSGMLSVTLQGDPPQIVGPAFSDGITGLTAAYAVLGALHARDRTGTGQLVEVPMLAATAAFLGVEAVETMTIGTPTAHGRPSRSQAYAGRCADGKIIVVHLSSPQKFWQRFTSALGRLDLASDPRFAAYSDRVAHYESLVEVIAGELGSKTQKEWLDIFVASDVPAAPVFEFDEMLDDAQSRHLGIRLNVPHPERGAVPTVAPPVRYSGTQTPALSAPPSLGQHTAEVRAEANTP